MDKKSKELMRKHKKTRPASSSDSSSSSDSDTGSSSDSYSSSSSDKKTLHKKSRKLRTRRSSSSTEEERTRKKEKHACHRKLEAKKLHLKRKLKEAKAKKRAMSPTQKKHHQMLKERLKEKEREREREKLRANRERIAVAAGRPVNKEFKSRSPSKVPRCRAEKQKTQTIVTETPQRHHHQISSREKIIIQTHRDRSPSERSKGSKDMRHRLDDRRERERAEAARQKEREEALARCQERQRERERLAREKMMRRDKDYDRERLLPSPAEREMAIAAARNRNSRDRSIEAVEIRRSTHGHSHSSRQRGDIDYERETYERERDFTGRSDRSLENDNRRGSEIDRDYLLIRRRDVSPGNSGHYSDRQRGSDREIYPDDERYDHDSYLPPQQRDHARSGYAAPMDEPHHRRSDRNVAGGGSNWDQSSHRDRADPRGLDHHDKHYAESKRDWKSKDDWESQHWEEGNNWSSPKQHQSRKKPLPLMQSDELWDDESAYGMHPAKKQKIDWNDPKMTSLTGSRLKHEHVRDDHGLHLSGSSPHEAPHSMPHQPHLPRRWPPHEWRGRAPTDTRIHGVGPGPVSYRHSSQLHAHPMDYNHERPDYRRPPHHLQPHMPHHHPTGYHQVRQTFPSKRQMTYTNPNILQNQKNQQAAAAAAVTPPIANTTQQVNAPSSQITSLNSFTTSSTVKSSKIPPLMQSTNSQSGEIISSLSKTVLPQAQPVSTVGQSVTSPEAGEISENNEAVRNTESDTQKKLECGEIAEESLSADGVTANTNTEEVIPDDLSEISDDADEILNKDEEISKNSDNKDVDEKFNDLETKEKPSLVQIQNVKDESQISVSENNSEQSINGGEQNDKDINDDLLDFEEISDGELEEETRKNLGDALGVDWASLVKDTKTKCLIPSTEQHATAKQKWQPHRLILDIGVSFKFAGEDFARKILSDAKQTLNDEQNQTKIESETDNEQKPEMKIKVEKEDNQNTCVQIDVRNKNNEDEELKNVEIKTENPIKMKEEIEQVNDENMSGIACLQVAERRAKEIGKNLVYNACGTNSRALSAQNDLNLRRQLCGLPATQIDRPHNISEKLKKLAVQAFQKAVLGEVK